MWRSSTGAVVEVDTVEIEYLREMRLMYEAVCNSTLTEERVRALHLLKRTASELNIQINSRLYLTDDGLLFLALEEERTFSQGTFAVGRS